MRTDKFENQVYPYPKACLRLPIGRQGRQGSLIFSTFPSGIKDEKVMKIR